MVRILKLLHKKELPINLLMVKIFNKFFINKQFAASIDNPTYWVTNRVRELLRWYRVFSGMRGFGTTENCALFAISQTKRVTIERKYAHE